MKTIIKLLLAAAIVNAVVRCGSAALDYYKLKDATQQIVLFAGGSTTEQLRNRILDKAMQLDVPLEPESLNIRRDGTLTVADATYTKQVEVFPRYKYPVTFTFSVDARELNTGAASTNP